MKSLLVLACLVLSSVSIAQNKSGPFVSSGMPGATLCTDAKQSYKLKFIVFGGDVFFEGTQIVDGVSQPLQYDCKQVNKVIPTILPNIMNVECSNDSGDAIELFKQNSSNASWGLLYNSKSIIPTSLTCQFGSL